MGSSRIKFITLICVVLFLLQGIAVEGQSEPDKIGAHAGDKYTYYFSEYEGLLFESFYFGLDMNMTFEKGDYFNITLVDADLFCLSGAYCDERGRFGIVLIESEEGSTTTANDGLNPYFLPYTIPTLFTFPDWDRWDREVKYLLPYIDLGGSFTPEVSTQRTDEYYQINSSSENEGVDYFVSNTYDLDTGVIIKQFVRYHGQAGDRDLYIQYELLRVNSVELDTTKSELSENSIELNYEVLQLDGASNVVFEGIDGLPLSLYEGDIFTITLNGDLPISDNRYIDILIESNGDTISYRNQLDALSTVEGFNFIVYEDWEYFNRNWENFQNYWETSGSSSIEDTTFISEENDKFFNYTLTLSSISSYFVSRVSYQKSTGFLQYQSIYEKSFSPFIPDLELTYQLINETNFDISKIGFNFGESHYWKIETLRNPYDVQIFNGKPILSNPKQGEYIEAFVTEVNLDKGTSLIEIDTKDGYTSTKSRLDFLMLETSFIDLRQFPENLFEMNLFVSTDWDYIAKGIQRRQDNKNPGESFEYKRENGEFEFKVSIVKDYMNLQYEITYNEQTGVLKHLVYSFQLFDNSGLIKIFDLELSKVDQDIANQFFETALPDDIEDFNPRRNSEESQSIGIGWQISFVIIPIVISRKKIKQ